MSNNILTRTLAGGIFVIIILGTIIWGRMPFAILFLIFLELAIYEYFRMMNPKSFGMTALIGMLSSAVIYMICLPFFENIGNVVFFSVSFAFFFLFFLSGLFSKTDSPVDHIMYSVAGVILITIPFLLLNKLFWITDYSLLHGKMFLIAFFVIQWVYDIFAYLFGKYYGKHKLFERVSPNKTWEGSLGGAIVALLFSFGISYFLDVGLINWLVITFLIIIFGTFGDLSISLVKRKYKVKDTGKIIPGHGGVLDRFDSVIFSAPAIYIYVNLVL